jgi:hypothetical protein
MLGNPCPEILTLEMLTDSSFHDFAEFENRGFMYKLSNIL